MESYCTAPDQEEQTHLWQCTERKKFIQTSVKTDELAQFLEEDDFGDES